MKLELRPMEQKDLQITFEWRNDPEVLKYAQTSQAISYKEHEAMFLYNNALKLVFEVDGIPAGYVSCSREPGASEGEWAFHIGSKHRGYNLSELMLRIALHYLKHTEKYERINSKVFNHNDRSNWLHTKLGFIVMGQDNDLISYTRAL